VPDILEGTEQLPAVVNLLALINHRKPCITTTTAAAAAAAADARDVTGVSIVDDFQPGLAGKVIEIGQQFVPGGKHLSRVAGEPQCSLVVVVVVVGQQGVPVVTQVELGVRSARMTLVYADQPVVAWISLEETAYMRRTRST